MLKHSSARVATLSLRAEGDHAVLTVADDGVGIGSALGGGAPGVHIGLQVMHERAAQVDGELSVLAGEQAGARVRCRVPLHRRG